MVMQADFNLSEEFIRYFQIYFQFSGDNFPNIKKANLKINSSVVNGSSTSYIKNGPIKVHHFKASERKPESQPTSSNISMSYIAL